MSKKIIYGTPDTAPKPNETPNKKPTSFAGKLKDSNFLIILAINVVVIPISAYATYVGLHKFIPWYLAFACALFSALLFIGFNLQLEEKKKAGERYLNLLPMYLLPLILSFSGNFNTFFGLQTKKEVLEQGVTDYMTTLNETHTSSITSIHKSSGLNELETMIKSELGQLRIQMQQGGYGRESRKKWNDIKRIFNTYNSQHLKTQTSGITEVINKSRFSTFERTALSYLNTIKAIKGQNIQNEIDKLNNIYNEVDSTYQYLSKSDLIKKEGVFFLQTITKANNNIANQANSYLQGTPLGKVTFKILEQHNGANVGTIVDSFKRGFVDIVNPVATVLSTIFSLIFDLAAPLYILATVTAPIVAVRPKDNIVNNITTRNSQSYKKY